MLGPHAAITAWASRLRTGAIDGLVLDWRETYNGATLTNTAAGTATVSPSGPAITLGNVLPGDSGSLSFRLRIDAEASETADGARELSVEPELVFSLTSDHRSPGIHEFIDVAVWYDSGLLGVDALGADNGERDLGERLVHPDASGTLREVGAALDDGVVIDGSPNAPGTSCLGVEDALTVTFGWSFPPDQKNINAVQGDVATFDIQLNVNQC